MPELLDLADQVVQAARVGEDIEAYAVHRISTTIQAGAGGEVRSVARAETRGVGVRLITGNRMGYASTADLRTTPLASTVERARRNASLGDIDVANLLPSPMGAAAPSDRDSDRLRTTPLEDKIALVTGLASSVVTLDARVRSLDTAEYHDERREVAVVSTRGIRTQESRTFVELWVDALGEDEHATASDYAYWCGLDPAEIDVRSLARTAVDRTARLLGPAARVPRASSVILDRNVAAELLAVVGRACTGSAMASGGSPLPGRVGSEVAAPCVSLIDDGLHRSSPAAASYDDEGVTRRRTDLITDGHIAGALHSTATAAAVGAGASSTGNARRASHKSPPRAAPTTLVLRPTLSLSCLLADAGEAVYVQQLSGAGVGISAITGRVNVGCVGWVLRNGEAVGRVPTTPLTGTLSTVLRAVTAVGDDTEQIPFTPVQASTVLCDSQLLAPES